jgi:dethiobiotin synthetase
VGAASPAATEPAVRPERVILVCGTGTGVGKTWVCSGLLGELRARGRSVAVRKPAQSFDVDSEGTRLGGATDAEVLASASGEDPGAVCRPSRSYHRAMAPPMAAEALGLPGFRIAELVGELDWPRHRVQVGVVETAGGVRSPQASDGDTTELLAALEPDAVVLVSDAGLGTINAVRLSMDALATVAGSVPSVPTVVLDRFDGHHDLHRRNRAWLADRLGYRVVTLPGEVSALADAVDGSGRPGP